MTPGAFALTTRFVGDRPNSKAFNRALDQEIDRFEKFLTPSRS